MNDEKNRKIPIKSSKKVRRSDRKDKKVPVLRTDAERRYEVNIIIKKLSELQLTMAYDPIRELYIILNDYIKNGGRKQINIPFPIINKRIKGILSDTTNEECCIKLEHEVY